MMCVAVELELAAARQCWGGGSLKTKVSSTDVKQDTNSEVVAETVLKKEEIECTRCRMGKWERDVAGAVVILLRSGSGSGSEVSVSDHPDTSLPLSVIEKADRILHQEVSRDVHSSFLTQFSWCNTLPYSFKKCFF